MKIRLGFFCLLAGFLVAGCSLFKTKPPMTQLEMRQVQTREYETKNTKLVMKAMLNVLQDMGYMVKQADADLGFLSATKETDVGGSFSRLLNVGTQGDARWKKLSVTECTANVTAFGKRTQVRATFVEKVLDNQGDVMEVSQINDGPFYQDFFSKVDKGIFIQKEKL